MLDQSHDGKAFRILNIIDEYILECLAICVKRRLNHQDAKDLLIDLFCVRGVPVHLCSVSGSEFTAKQTRAWLSRLAVKPFFEPGNPWENGYIVSFNGKMRDEFLDRDLLFREGSTGLE